MSDEKKSFVVKDKRRFDADGTAREESEQASSAAETTVEKSADTSVAGAESASEEKISFSSFVVSLATQALMMLGELKPPEGVPIRVDKHGAKNTIDVLSLLEQKTKGNLDAAEVRLLEEVLHNLRMIFLRKG